METGAVLLGVALAAMVYAPPVFKLCGVFALGPAVLLLTAGYEKMEREGGR